MGLIGCFQVFDQVFVMSDGGPNNATTTMSYYVYQNAFRYFRLGYGAATAIVLAGIIMIVTVIQKKYFPPNIRVPIVSNQDKKCEQLKFRKSYY
jgi:multiple sugar transport system permease protein